MDFCWGGGLLFLLMQCLICKLICSKFLSFRVLIAVFLGCINTNSVEKHDFNKVVRLVETNLHINKVCVFKPCTQYA